MSSWFVVLFLRVRKEVDDVIGMKKDISYDDLGELIYLSQVFLTKWWLSSFGIRVKTRKGFSYWWHNKPGCFTCLLSAVLFKIFQNYFFQHCNLAQVLKETLRIYPTVPNTSRMIEEDMVIDGVHIPAGVTCFVSHSFIGVFVPPKLQVCVRI